MAHFLVEKGIGAIIGHHPHVIRKVEYYQTKRDALRLVLIFYSLGNLMSRWSADYLCKSLEARMTLVKGRHRNGAQKTYVRTARGVEVQQIADLVDQTISLTKVENTPKEHRQH
jgi:poly-gamma-glutamate capsule biosynthesis protein CapA/YwtB (metallophosphatase superfamily)